MNDTQALLKSNSRILKGDKMSKVIYKKILDDLEINVTEDSQVEIYETQVDGSQELLDPETWNEYLIDIARAVYLESRDPVIAKQKRIERDRKMYRNVNRFTAEILERFEYELHDMISVSEHEDLAAMVVIAEHEIKRIQRYCEDHLGEGPRLSIEGSVRDEQRRIEINTGTA